MTPDEEKSVARVFGKVIGYGRMMRLGEQLWREDLIAHGYPPGGEFSIGPCAAMMVACIHPIKDKNGHCEVCCGSGLVTKFVAAALSTSDIDPSENRRESPKAIITLPPDTTERIKRRKYECFIESDNPVRDQVGRQCKAVAHLALALAQIHRDYQGVFVGDLSDAIIPQVGARTAHLMEVLGDALNDMDAAAAEDEWLDPIFEEARRLWPAAGKP